MINQAMNQSRERLGELAVMQRRIDESEKMILRRAETRLNEVNTRIQEIWSSSLERPREYMDLMQERGMLNMVIAQARASIQ
ncbi:MAG: hypothetical protein KBF68_01015 [Nitrosomonas sp.]|jgi:hypothetical protein|nr:hypothetical protein [Nitrosomonas sp.]MBP9099963.1 hypothetical protein [Nitrosomonas sp.]